MNVNHLIKPPIHWTPLMITLTLRETIDILKWRVTISFHPALLLGCFDTEFEINLPGDGNQITYTHPGLRDINNYNPHFGYEFEMTFTAYGPPTWETIMGYLPNFILKTVGHGIWDFYENEAIDQAETLENDCPNFRWMVSQFFNNQDYTFYRPTEACNWEPPCFLRTMRNWFTFKDKVNTFVNDLDLDNGPPAPCNAGPVLFAEKIQYEKGIDGLSSGFHNGLISGIQWRILDEPIRMYGFEYDDSKRLEKANYDHRQAYYQSPGEELDAFSTGYKYDDNGNITEIKRRGITNYYNGYPIYTTIDHLEFTHSENQLNTISQIGLYANKGYKTANGGGAYQYDDAGNVTVDAGRNVIINEYNSLDLPEDITKSNPSYTITNTYDASGTRISTDANGETIQYLNGIELVGNKIIIHHEEGRLVNGHNTPVAKTPSST